MIKLNSSFPVIHLIGNVGIFVLLKFVNREIEKSVTSIVIQITMTIVNLLAKLIRFLIVYNLFPSEVVLKCQHFFV